MNEEYENNDVCEDILNLDNTDYLYSNENNKYELIPARDIVRRYDHDKKNVSKDEMLIILKRNWKTNLEQLRLILDYCDRNRCHRNYLFITQTDELLISFYKRQDVVSRKIDLLVNLGVLTRMKEYPYVPHKYSQHYYFNKDNYLTIMSIYEEKKDNLNLINKTMEECEEQLYAKNNVLIEYLTTKEGENVQTLLESNKVFFSSKIKLDRNKFSPIQVQKAVSYLYVFYYIYVLDLGEVNSFIETKLKEQFPNKEDFDRYWGEEKISFDIKLKGKKTISSIGIRAFCHICQAPSREKAILNNKPILKDITYREDYLKERFGDEKPDEYDVHGSVPRIARALSKVNGVFIGLCDLNSDPYKEMFLPLYDEYRLHINPNCTSWEDARDFFKGLFMRLYFGGSVNEIVNGLIFAEKKEAEKYAEGKITKRELEWVKVFINNGCGLCEFVSKLKERVVQYLSLKDERDTSVFLYESCIYIGVRKILARRNIDCIQVYDGFYFKKGTMPLDMDEIIKQAFNEFTEQFHAYGYDSIEEKENIEKFLYKEISYSKFKENYKKLKKEQIVDNSQ